MVTHTHNTQADVLSLLSGVAQELEKGRNKVGEPTVVEDVWVHAGHVWAPYVHDGLMAGESLGLVVADGVTGGHPSGPPRHSLPWVCSLVLGNSIVPRGECGIPSWVRVLLPQDQRPAAMAPRRAHIVLVVSIFEHVQPVLYDGLEQRLDSVNVVHVADVQDVENVLHVDKHELHREVHAQVHLGPEPLDPVASGWHKTVAGAVSRLLS